MAPVVTQIATSLLIFICTVQGTRSLQIEHQESVNATVGQNISLSCIVTEELERNINQLEWHKGEKQTLVVFNPIYDPYYHANVTLQPVYKPVTKRLQGSILHLYNVTEKQSGIYICSITSFPDGSFSKSIKVKITDPWISANILSPDESVIEGDEVKISCASNPPADSFSLSSLQSNLSLQSWSGQFTVQNVTRHSSDLVCRPLWNSSNQHLKSLRASIHLTVDFLDNIECNSENQTEIEIGTNLTITCKANSSKPLQYIWMKGNTTVTHSATISLWLVNLGHSGIYSLFVHTGNNSLLRRQRDFVVTVFNRTLIEHHSSTISMETATTQVTEGTTLTTGEPSPTTVKSQIYPVNSTVYSTTAENDLYSNTTAPSAGNITTSHANMTTAPVVKTSLTATSLSSNSSTLSGDWQTVTTREVITQTRVNISTAIFTSTSLSKSTLTTENILTSENFTVKSVKDGSSKTHIILVLIPVLLLLVLIGFLYRRYRIQKRMDMPPPFKPPPPPVKYTSVRSQEATVTDILV